MKRKQFLKTGCTLCMGAMAGFAMVTLMDSCAAGKIIKQEISENSLKVEKSVFTSEITFVLVRASSLSFDILLNKSDDANYTALLMQCTHYDNPVFANKKELFCPSHGSKFNFKGEVTKEPATQNLKQYPTKITDSSIIIFIS